MTVYKNTDLEADAASKLAIALIKGDTARCRALVDDTVASRTPRPKQGRPVRAGHPGGDHDDNIKKPFDDGFAKASDVCTGAVRQACTQARHQLARPDST